MVPKRPLEAVEPAQTSAKKPKGNANHTDSFDPSLFPALESYKSSYASSSPYLHGVIPKLIADPLLRAVRDEIRSHITFTPKETDIYKIHQSGDLANLDGLDSASLQRLPSLVKLRDALYSHEFRSFLEQVTGSGKLSGTKTDMAVNVYTPGCHLLCHDDVIGTRRVSYILYLTDPDKPWQESWGGGLRLFPTSTVTASVDADDATTTSTSNGRNKNKNKNKATPQERQFKIPHHTTTKTIPPAWNQLSFFAVQPGESFHDVEEVYARSPTDPGDDVDGGRIRMAISGWFHIPQEGEDGYMPGAAEAQAERSSLAQLQGRGADRFDRPQPKWSARDDSIEHSTELAPDMEQEDMDMLIQFLNPRYLVPDTVEELAENFGEDSSLRLGMFLAPKVAETLKSEIDAAEARRSSSQHPEKGWDVACPPHKARYLFRQPDASVTSDTTPTLTALTNVLFPSGSFRKWLSLATGLSLDACNVLARRFRRGMDYTLATSYDQAEPQLEICLGLTPTQGWGAEAEADGEADADAEAGTEELGQDLAEASSSAAASAKAQAPMEEATNDSDDGPAGGVGGYDLYMAADDVEDDDDIDIDDDAARDENDDANGQSSTTRPDESQQNGSRPKNAVSTHTGAGRRRERPDPAIYRSAQDQEDDGILLSVPAEWNCLNIVLRDQGVMRFVKYVSKSAKGDRWDLCGEWKVDGTLEEDDDDDMSDGDGGEEVES